jgi:hypothetical protein
MGGECSIYDRGNKCIQNCRKRERNGCVLTRNKCVRMDFKEWDISLWIGFMWHRTGAS